jgi:hypothetical protein
MSVDNRDLYNLKKIQRFNNIDQKHSSNTNNMQDLKPQKVDKVNIDLNKLVQDRKQHNQAELDESIKKRTNLPYKGIIKNFDFNKIRANHKEDLIVHKVTEADKKTFNEDISKYSNTITKQQKELSEIYAENKKNEHKKNFEYQHKYKYRTKLDVGDGGGSGGSGGGGGGDGGDGDVRIDRIEYYKKEQLKVEESKKKMDDILMNLINKNAISENLDNFDINKIDIKDINELANYYRECYGEDPL